MFPYRRARYGLHFNNHSFQQAYRTEPTEASVKRIQAVLRARARKNRVSGASAKRTTGYKAKIMDNAKDAEKQRRQKKASDKFRAKKRKEKEEKKRKEEEEKKRK